MCLVGRPASSLVVKKAESRLGIRALLTGCLRPAAAGSLGDLRRASQPVCSGLRRLTQPHTAERPEMAAAEGQAGEVQEVVSVHCWLGLALTDEQKVGLNLRNWKGLRETGFENG